MGSFTINTMLCQVLQPMQRAAFSRMLAAPSSRMINTKVTAWAALEVKAPLTQFEYEIDEVCPPGYVDLAVTYCGICGSDVHQIEDSWGVASFPLVPGHEIVGNVVAVGEGVSSVSVGDRGAIGTQRSSCGNCGNCKAGFENVCAAITKTYAGPGNDKGGFANLIRYPADWVFNVPAALESEYVGPLMCAGITTYSPLKRHAKSGDRVGVIGIGGLGHLALQFGKGMGYDMVAFSNMPGEKEEAEAKSFGANEFIVVGGPDDSMPEASSFDMILNTASAHVPLDPYLALLKPHGTLACVSLPDKTAKSQLFLQSVVPTEKSLTGSYLGPRGDYEEMLSFAMEHDVRPMIELYPADQINEAVERVAQGKARYRAVLEMPK